MDDSILQFLQSTNAVPIFAGTVGIGGLVLVKVWYKLRVKQWEMSLKHTMLERGMSAADIKAVLEASAMDGEKKHGCWTRGRLG